MMDINLHDIGQRIAYYRARLEMTTQTLARKVNKSLATISRIENDKQAVSLELLVAIAEVLHVHPFTLLSDEPLAVTELIPTLHKKEAVPGAFATFIVMRRKMGEFSQELAAQAIDIPLEDLRAIEYGVALPSPAAVERMGTLYGVDPAELNALIQLERDAPSLSRRMAAFGDFVLQLIRELDQSGHATEAQRVGRIASFLADRQHTPEWAITRISEEQRKYYRTWHLSDVLLNALQDREFHAWVEQLAKEWDRTRADTGSGRPKAPPPLDIPPAPSVSAPTEPIPGPGPNPVTEAIDGLLDEIRPPSPPASTSAPARDHMTHVFNPAPTARRDVFPLDADDPLLERAAFDEFEDGAGEPPAP